MKALSRGGCSWPWAAWRGSPWPVREPILYQYLPSLSFSTPHHSTLGREPTTECVTWPVPQIPFRDPGGGGGLARCGVLSCFCRGNLLIFEVLKVGITGCPMGFVYKMAEVKLETGVVSGHSGPADSFAGVWLRLTSPHLTSPRFTSPTPGLAVVSRVHRQHQVADVRRRVRVPAHGAGRPQPQEVEGRARHTKRTHHTRHTHHTHHTPHTHHTHHIYYTHHITHHTHHTH